MNINTYTNEKRDASIAHTDLKPGDRFRLTETDEGYRGGPSVVTIYEGTVYRVEDGKVFCGPKDYDYLYDHENATWERLAPAEPKNLGAVVEFTTKHSETRTVVRAFGVDEFPFYDGCCMETFAWKDILEEDANPRVLHEGWDGK